MQNEISQVALKVCLTEDYRDNSKNNNEIIIK